MLKITPKRLEKRFNLAKRADRDEANEKAKKAAPTEEKDPKEGTTMTAKGNLSETQIRAIISRALEQREIFNEVKWPAEIASYKK